jgi:hypothetical protein
VRLWTRPDSAVTIGGGLHRLEIGVNIALGNAPLSVCPAFDANHDQTVAINLKSSPR